MLYIIILFLKNERCIMQYLLISLGAYLFGAVPFGFLIGKMYGKDIRLEGSGNIGATNVTRVIGKKAGKVCFALDFLKGILPVLAVKSFCPETGGAGLLLAGALCIAGHMFPVYLGFKGGKGISTAGGVAAAMCYQMFIIVGLVWVVVFLTSRYVSLASITAAAVLPLGATLLTVTGAVHVSLPVLVFFYFIAVVAVWKHRSNIERLRNGTELRFSKKDKTK